jgi:IS5 family transposase
MNIYQPSFFDEADRLATLTKLKDPLVELKRHIDFEIFRPQLASVFTKEKKSAAGRKGYDVVFMFQILILQRLYNLSDEQAEYQINDRQSFQRFLGLHLGSTVPDFSTVWLFREALTKAEVIKPLFHTFGANLENQGLITKTGTMVDASFVEVPRQRNTREENAMIKKGEVPEDWKKQPHKLSQKDLDAQWAKKNQETYFGYKNHVRADAESVFITDFAVTDASVHDSQPLPELINKNNKDENLFADSAYKSKKIDAKLEELGIKNYIHEKGTRNHPLNDLHKGLNRLKSKIRCRIEHIFGCVENSMGGPELEYIGRARITTGIGLSNLAYNLLRYVQLIRLGRVPAVAACLKS